MVAVFCLTKPMKNDILQGGNELQQYGNVATTNKQYKIGQDMKEMKIITKSDVLEDIMMTIETEFGGKLVEHKE